MELKAKALASDGASEEEDRNDEGNHIAQEEVVAGSLEGI